MQNPQDEITLRQDAVPFGGGTLIALVLGSVIWVGVFLALWP
jgi:hypothetical protein